MNVLIRLMLLGVLLSITSCQEEETSRETARVQREVNRQVAIVREELKTSENLWHTVRVTAFCILAGGCLIWLLGGIEGTNISMGPPPLPNGHLPDQQPGRRIIDRRPEEHGHESDDDPYPN